MIWASTLNANRAKQEEILLPLEEGLSEIAERKIREFPPKLCGFYAQVRENLLNFEGCYLGCARWYWFTFGFSMRVVFPLFQLISNVFTVLRSPRPK